MRPYISAATARNWSRLKTDDRTRLTARANKKKSQKKILPIEYFTDTENRVFAQDFLVWFEQNAYPLGQILYSFAVSLLMKKRILHESHVQSVLKDYHFQKIPYIENLDIPLNEWDFLGLMYQCLLAEGEKNQMGAYYTPKAIAQNMTKDFDFSQLQTLLDPCCGSGSFLLAAESANPECLFGIDHDPIAVFIAKINLLLKYDTSIFVPNVFCLDYLAQHSLSDILCKKFDYIVTNPPWGAISMDTYSMDEITSKESFSYFFIRAYKQLKEKAHIRFLFPESILNVKNHKDIRSFLLNRCGLEQITLYGTSFSGVTTKYIDIRCTNSSPDSKICLKDQNEIHEISTDCFRQTENVVFSFLTQEDMEILRRVKESGKYSLSESVWALGIVTGDNKSKLKEKPERTYEAIFTGKEIRRYNLLPAKHYLCYNRSQLQQAAKEEYYRAPEKLVYKFISNRLVFAYDDSKSLFLNSANILIPCIPGMSMKTVLAFLNSELFQFFYVKMFGEIKVLKGNLMEIPFPEVTSAQNREFESLVNEILNGKSEADDVLQEKIYSLYHFTAEQQLYIRGAFRRDIRKREK